MKLHKAVFQARRSSKWLHVIFCVSLLGAVPHCRTADADSFSGKVIAVNDGDTIEVLRNGRAVRIRLAHIDAPERKQPFGTSAKKFVSDLCFDKIVLAQIAAPPDRYGRSIAEIFVKDICVNQELVKAGLAWHYKYYSADTSYAAMESVAKANRLGLWIDADAIAPWDWRRNKRSAAATVIAVADSIP